MKMSVDRGESLPELPWRPGQFGWSVGLQEVTVIRVVISTVMVFWPKIPLGARKAICKAAKAIKNPGFMMTAIGREELMQKVLQTVKESIWVDD
jgi:hypothetical protein